MTLPLFSSRYCLCCDVGNIEGRGRRKIGITEQRAVNQCDRTETLPFISVAFLSRQGPIKRWPKASNAFGQPQTPH